MVSSNLLLLLLDSPPLSVASPHLITNRLSTLRPLSVNEKRLYPSVRNSHSPLSKSASCFIRHTQCLKISHIKCLHPFPLRAGELSHTDSWCHGISRRFYIGKVQRVESPRKVSVRSELSIVTSGFVASGLKQGGFDPIRMQTAAHHAIKERFLNFVRSLSTVLAFAYCTASLTKQIQKFVERNGGSEETRNLGIQFVGNTVYTLVWVAAVFLFMELLGFSTQKWITAGGFGTVLITLAARELVTNFLSSIIIHATRPFMVNEWIQTKIDGYEVSGTVEHVGWWEPTIIRGDDRESIYIPNHKFTVTVVRNLSQKTHWRIKTYFAVSHLDINKIGEIVATMRKVIAKHPQIEQKHLHRRVFLEGVNQDSNALMIMLSCFVKTSHFEEYLRVKEMVILDMLKVISHYGARLATPLRGVQRMYDETEPRGSGFKEYGGNRATSASSSRPFLLLSQTDADQGQDVQQSYSPVYEVPSAPASPSSPSSARPSIPTQQIPLKEAIPDSFTDAKTVSVRNQRMDSDMPPSTPEKLNSVALNSPGLGSPVPATASGNPKPLPDKNGLASNYSGRDDRYDSGEESDFIVGLFDGLRGADVPKTALQNPLSPVSTPSPSMNSPQKSTPVPASSPSATSFAGTRGLAGLDSMGLNEKDITLLGAAFEKSHSNVSKSPSEATVLAADSSFPKAELGGVVSIELEDMINSRPSSFSQRNSNGGSDNAIPPSETVICGNDVPTSLPPLPLSHSSSSSSLSDMDTTRLNDFWHTPAVSSISSSSGNDSGSSADSSSSQDSLKLDALSATYFSSEIIGSSDECLVLTPNNNDISVSSPAVAPPGSVPNQPVEENIVLDVAIHGLKKTLPLDDNSPSTREEEKEMSTTASKPNSLITDSPQANTSEKDSQVKLSMEYSSKDMDK